MGKEKMVAWGMKGLSCILLILTLFAASISFAETQPKAGTFTVVVRDSRISVKAVDAGFKELLKEVAAKTGIKVKILDSVQDKKVSLDVKDIPIYAISELLDRMEIKNYGVGYERDKDQKMGALFVYVVDAGTDIREVMKDKTVIRRGNFAARTDADRVKGKEIVSDEKKGYAVRYLKDEVLLKFHRGVTKKEIDEILKKHNLIASKDNALSPIGYIKATIPDGRDVKDVAKEITKERQLKLPEPNYVQTVLTSPTSGSPSPQPQPSPVKGEGDLKVSDPLYADQWYVPDTSFDKAWEKAKSKTIVKVAVIDSGVQLDHADLKGKLLKGYDFVNGDEDASDDNGHGTFVAGIIAAAANDAGIKGLYDYARIIPIKVMDSNGLGTYEDAARGILYAADSGAKVINLSIGGYGFSYMLQDAVDYALEKGCIVVAAGGNDGIEREIYPAAYPDVIGVSALEYNNVIWSSSNNGRHIDVSAPGANIISTGLNGEYNYATGTSASAPMVSALAAMLASERADLSSSSIERLMMQSARDLGDKGRDKVYGSGEIDAATALEQKVRSFHDVAVRRVNIEPMVFEKGKPTYIVADIENVGTYSPEVCDVVLNEVVGDKKKEIGRKTGIVLVDKQKVAFEWVPEEVLEGVKFEVVAVSARDANNSNNSKTTYSFYIKEQEGVFVLLKNMPFVHSWAAYQAFNLLPTSSLKTEMNNYLWGGATPDQLFGLDRIWPSSYAVPDTWSPTETKTGSSLFEGTWEEDEDDYSITGLSGADSALRHFWDPDSGYNFGLDTWVEFGRNNSALFQAQDWWDQAITAYPNNQGLAYYYLGRIVHLLGDMAVPEHVHLDQHPGDAVDIFASIATDYDDYSNYEEYTKIYYRKNIASGAIKDINLLPLSVPLSYAPESFDPGLVKLFYNMAQYTQHFDSSDVNGNNSGYGGSSINMGVDVTTYGNGHMNQDYDAIAYLANNDRIDPGTTPTIIWQKCNFLCLSYYDYQTLYEGPSIDSNNYFELSRGYGQIGYSRKLWFAQNGTTDRLKVTYIYKGVSKTDYITNPKDVDLIFTDPYTNVPDRYISQQMDVLFPENIRYTAALYKLFWGTTHPPTVSITAPANNGTISGTTSVTVSVSDDVTKVNYYLDNSTTVYRSVNAPPFSFSLGTTTISNGLHSITAKSYNIANKESQPSTISVTVNNSTGNNVPNIPSALSQYKSDGFTGMGAGETTSERTVVMKGSVSDSDNDAVSLEVEIKSVGTTFSKSPSSNCVSSGLVSSGGTAVVTCSGLANGQYHWQARAKDNKGAAGAWQPAGGNLETTADFIVSAGTAVVNTPPTVILIAPTTGETLTVNSSYTIKWSAIDDTGTIDKVEIYLSTNGGVCSQ